MHVNRICEDLIRGREIEPIIVVAIENGPSQRTVDLTPWPAPYWLPNGGGDLFARAIRDTLKPEVDRRYRTLTDAANTAIAGSSLGGLFATYVGYAYDETFGKVAAFSPTYLWERDTIYTFARQIGRPPRLARFYLDTGFPEDNDISEMEKIALDQGFIEGVDFLSITASGAVHAHPAWEHRYPEMLKFLFGQ